MAGADFVLSGTSIRAGSFVPQISHSRRDGWLRNVHAGHGIELCLRDWDVGGVDGDEEDVVVGLNLWVGPEGRDVDKGEERGCSEVDVAAAGRGTPQSSQTCVEDGLCPGGLRFLYAHTPHSHVPPSALPDTLGMSRVAPDEVALAFTALPIRYKVTLGDEVNRPA